MFPHDVDALVKGESYITPCVASPLHCYQKAVGRKERAAQDGVPPRYHVPA